MDIITIIAYVITVAIGIIGTKLFYTKALHALKDLGTLITDASNSLADGNLTKAELEQIIADAKAIIEALKG